MMSSTRNFDFLDFNYLQKQNPEYTRQEIIQLYKLFESYGPQNGVVESKQVAEQFQKARGSENFQKKVLEKTTMSFEEFLILTREYFISRDFQFSEIEFEAGEHQPKFDFCFLNCSA